MQFENELNQLHERIASLESQLERHQARCTFQTTIDGMLEVASRDQWSLRRTLDAVLPELCKQTGAFAARAHTYDEDLELRKHWFVVDGCNITDLVPLAEIECAARAGQLTVARDSYAIVTYPLNVAGQNFGDLLLVYNRIIDQMTGESVSDLLRAGCELLDNHLAAAAAARRKQIATTDLSAALKDPHIDVGIANAIGVLQHHVGFDQLVLVYVSEPEVGPATVGYKVARHDGIVCDSSNPGDTAIDRWMQSHADDLTQGRTQELVDLLQLGPHREEVLFSGVRNQRIVGRILVSSKQGEFSTNDRDLLERFSDFLRQRIVDFNREWRYLSLCFPKPAVERLLRQENYAELHLKPSLRTVAVLFCDIVGFTRISEQVLRDSDKIGCMFNQWSAGIVDLIWQHGGVLDKMVGDCAIGLWGPPFFESSPAETCAAALACARAVRDFTASVVVQQTNREMRSDTITLSLATALNFCPLYVGHFGPNADYTGFGSGMNNAARLQGVAGADEILGMEDFVQALGQPQLFGPLQHAAVKNVAFPLRYHALQHST